MLRDTFFTKSDPKETDTSLPETGELELPVDLLRVKDKLIARTPIVGVDISRVSVSLGQNQLTIHKAAVSPTLLDEPDRVYSEECHWGELSRSIDLPMPVNPDNTRASLHNGILTVIMPILNPQHSKIIRIKKP